MSPPTIEIELSSSYSLTLLLLVETPIIMLYSLSLSLSTCPQKSDSLGKLFEMDDNPDRKPWLDRLLGFMDEKRTPITACPTISKQPLDLFRLYLLVKERAGYIEVSTSNKFPGCLSVTRTPIHFAGDQEQDVERHCGDAGDRREQ